MHCKLDGKLCLNDGLACRFVKNSAQGVSKTFKGCGDCNSCWQDLEKMSLGGRKATRKTSARPDWGKNSRTREIGAKYANWHGPQRFIGEWSRETKMDS